MVKNIPEKKVENTLLSVFWTSEPRVPAGSASSEASLPGSWGASSRSQAFAFTRVCVLTSSCEDIGQVRLGPTLTELPL